jgi:hypothetical protein
VLQITEFLDARQSSSVATVFVENVILVPLAGKAALHLPMLAHATDIKSWLLLHALFKGAAKVF